MPNNLFEYGPQSFRLYDIDGVVLDNPMDYIIIHEPVNFGETKIKLTRDRKTHGFNYEFSDIETPFGFDHVLYAGEPANPYDLILGVYNANGVDGRVLLEFRNDSETPEVQYQANLDFETIMIFDDIIELAARRVSFDDLFKTRTDVDISFEATESIDGESITPPSSQSMFLHSKLISQLNTNENGSQIELQGIYVGSPVNSAVMSVTGGFTVADLENTRNEIVFSDESRAYGATSAGQGVVGTSSAPYRDLYSIYEFIFGGCFFANVEERDYTYKIRISAEGNADATSTSYAPYVDFILYEIQDGTIVNSTSFHQETGSVGGNFNFDFDVTETFTKEKTDLFVSEFFLVVDMDTIDVEFEQKTITIDSLIFEIEVFSYYDNSFCEVFSSFDAFSHILQSITNEANSFESSFFSNEASEIFLTDGYRIRNFEGSMKASFELLFDKWAQPSFGLGYQIYNESGSYKLLMEPYDFFYRDVEIDYIEEIVEGSFEIMPDNDIIYSSISTGYKNFPKSTDENKKNNIDEFNTKHDHITTVKSIKNKVEYISEVIASGYKTENQRREQFRDVPNDTVSDDEEIFCIKGIESDRYESVIVTFDNVGDRFLFVGGFYNFIVGETITIDGSTSNDTSFTIESIETGAIVTSLFVAESVTHESPKAVSIIKSSSFLRAERNEAFDVLSGVIDPATVYNVGLNPKNMLLNQSPIINSGLSKKSASDEIKTQRVYLNSEMSFQFSSGQGQYVLGAGSEIGMSDNLPLSGINSFDRLFTGDLIRFRANLTYNRVLGIRDSCINEDGSTDFGYLRVNNNGVDWKIFLLDLTYSLIESEAEFLGRVKYDGGSS